MSEIHSRENLPNYIYPKNFYYDQIEYNQIVRT